MPKLEQIKKVLVIGSGPIVIGQAAEFDYAGTQACLALKEEGVEVVLVNNNPATIMTDEHIADHVYLEPLTLTSLTNIIAKEQPDGLLPTLGGQTGLNLATELTAAGVLEQYHVTLLGTPLETIQKGEDREVFKSMMKKMGEPIAESVSTSSADQAIHFAEKVGYPLIIRPAYTLGGAGGGIANDEAELKQMVKHGIHASPISQVLIEQSVKGWKEIEYEVMRDGNDTCIIVCNMENLDPVGVHTGDSIVVAPSQTLTDQQYQMLRTSSTSVIRELGVIGGCNIQFALNPVSNEYIIIEVNPRVSRSSALASKATGYPIASIAAKLALGYHLDEVINPITRDTYASFEPAIDYIAVKIPRWPFDKFYQAERSLGTQMKATGEVMALARNFPTALNKAIRSLEIGLDSLTLPTLANWSDQAIYDALVNPTDERLFVLAEAYRRGYTINQLHDITAITTYFLHEIALMLEIEEALKQKDWQAICKSDLKKAKQFGMSNKTLSEMWETSDATIQARLEQESILPSYKMVDTCAAEFRADTPYFYSTWNEFDEVEPLTGKKRVVVLGSGPIRIGQGVEFDYCSVHAAMSLKAQGIDAVVVNNNPETVSTDFHTADHLYFEPLTEEDVLQVVKKEQVDGVLIQFGGQTAINLASGLSKHGVETIGVSMDVIEATEDREHFYQLLKKLCIPHIPGDTVMSTEGAIDVATQVGYPILIRPSYVIGGQGMVILQNEAALISYLNQLQTTASYHCMFPLLIDRYIEGKEVEVDAVCDGEDVIIPGIFEHVEKAGVHSGDSIAIFPAPSLSEQQKQLIAQYTKQIANALQVKGMLNIQFVLDTAQDKIYCLEVNPRASRTVPIASKVTGVPLIDLATRVQMGEKLCQQVWKVGLHENIPFYAAKMPVFSTNKLPGVDPILVPEMKSTGEAIGIGSTVEAALTKAFGWQKGYLKSLTSDITMYLSLQQVDNQLVQALQLLKAELVADPTTTSLLDAKGVSVTRTETLASAISATTDEVFTVICSTKRDMLSTRLRTDALRIGTICFSSNQTLLAFLQATNQTLEAPLTIMEYQQKQSTRNKKEGMIQ
ncbi:carbamoyl phosphate synthase large subunit [Paraliobacillus ryukyuensis]|uniref:carbamoyl phosphate synthase large subunit n=1 Tax=Paraliobacillus ryukyuensis TaxID=200904 RepID=UPI0009A72A4D|nr:carbamoyl phosphate synthase large subunit [Paraliobacillus ryukyuensis]